MFLNPKLAFANTPYTSFSVSVSIGVGTVLFELFKEYKSGTAKPPCVEAKMLENDSLRIFIPNVAVR